MCQLVRRCFPTQLSIFLAAGPSLIPLYLKRIARAGIFLVFYAASCPSPLAPHLHPDHRTLQSHRAGQAGRVSPLPQELPAECSRRRRRRRRRRQRCTQQRHSWCCTRWWCLRGAGLQLAEGAAQSILAESLLQAQWKRGGFRRFRCGCCSRKRYRQEGHRHRHRQRHQHLQQHHHRRAVLQGSR